MTYEVYTGGPESAEGRQEREIRTYQLLSQLDIEFQRVDHEAVPTMEACRGIDKALGISMCKNLFLTNAQKTNFYLLLMPGRRSLRQRISPGRSSRHGFLSRARNSSKNFWISCPEQSASWD